MSSADVRQDVAVFSGRVLFGLRARRVRADLDGDGRVDPCDGGGVRFAEYRALACEQEDVVGPYGGSSAVVFRTLEVDEDGEYEVTMIGENVTGRSAGASIYMVSCGACTRCGWSGRRAR